MRAKVLAVVVIMLALGAVMAQMPAEAQTVTTSAGTWSGSSYGLDLVITVNKSVQIPAGHVTIWFSDREGGDAEYWYLGGNRVITVPHLDSFRYCMFRVELQGAYKEQAVLNPVTSSWKPVSGQENVFYAPVNGGENWAQIWIGGKKKTSLQFLFWSVGVGSKTVWSADSFRVYDRMETGLSDIKAQREIAAATWPSLGPADWDLWARMWVYETHYLSQGLVSTGTESNPVVSTASLKALFDLRQKRASVCDGPKYLGLEVRRLDMESGEWVEVWSGHQLAPPSPDAVLPMRWDFPPGRVEYRWGVEGWREIWASDSVLYIPAPEGASSR